MLKSLAGTPSYRRTPFTRERRITTISTGEGCIWRIDLNPLLEEAYARSCMSCAGTGWPEAMMEVAKCQPEVSFRGGVLKTSKADPSFETRYQPTVGSTIAAELPWLVELYRGAFRDLIAALKGDPSITAGANLKRYINMNLTRGLRNSNGEPRGYELHEDDCKVSIVVAACSAQQKDWGGTRFFDQQGELITVMRPKLGFGIIFDGHLGHDVEPWRGSDDRLVLTCNYFGSDFPEPLIPEEAAESALFGT